MHLGNVFVLNKIRPLWLSVRATQTVRAMLTSR
jgi:hypothetical protein